MTMFRAPRGQGRVEETIHNNISGTANANASNAANLEKHVFGVIITGSATVAFRWATGAAPSTFHEIDNVTASGTVYINASHPVLNVNATIASGNVTVVHYAYKESA